MMKTLTILACAAAIALPAAAEVKVTVLEIQENRTATLAKPEGERGMDVGERGNLIVEVLLEGPEVSAATHYGEIKFSEAADDTGKSLKPQGSTFSADRFEELNREHMWFMRDDPPEDQIKLSLTLNPAERAAGSIRLLEGTINLRTTETHDVLATPAEKLAIDDEQLTASGAKITVKSVDPAAGEIELVVDDGDEKLGHIDLVDAAGESVSRSRSSFGFNKRQEISISTGEAFGDAVKLKIPVVTKVTNVEVPFKLENLKLP